MDQLEAMEPHCRIAWFSATTTKSLDMKLLASLLMAAVLAAPALPAFATDAAPAPAKPDLAKGEASYSTVCVACHGANFSAPLDPAYPRLAGQHADYLYVALKAYHTDGNPHIGRNNATMRAQVVQEADGKKKLTFTNAELKQMAQYLASLPGDLRVVPQSRFR